tara:strand:+ start:7619 stop:8158 length:540 start_codon:yes stop_codon:yes gene_type:complete
MSKTKGEEVGLQTRFWFRTGYVDPRSDECMLWLGRKTAQGYGQLTGPNGDTLYAHRVSYELVNGEIPDGYVVRHRCPSGPNPTCVRPNHLTVGTYADNAKDIVEDGRTQVINPPCPDTVAAIRYLYASKRFSQGDIAKMVFGTGAAQPTVNRIVQGKTHQDADGPLTIRGRGNQPKERI